MQAIFINGSPRKKGNTAQLLLAAQEGAAAAGAETTLYHLGDFQFTGCKSCFACKRKGSTTNGVCALRDQLRPVLEAVMAADVLVIGSPVYFGSFSAGTMALWERLLYPVLNYKVPVDGKRPRTLPKEKAVGLVVDMNCPAPVMEQNGYKQAFDAAGKTMANLLGDGTCPVVYACNTWQFDNYDNYDVNMFDVEDRRRHRQTQFPQDLEQARQMGLRLVEKAAKKNEMRI